MTLGISPVSFSRLPEVGNPCAHVYAVRRRPTVTCVVRGVFEVRVRRVEIRGRDPGEPEAEGPKGGCLKYTPDITMAAPYHEAQRTTQMETVNQWTTQMKTVNQRTIQMDPGKPTDKERPQGS